MQIYPDAVTLYSFSFACMEIYYGSINAIISFKCIRAGTLILFKYTSVFYTMQLLYAAKVFISTLLKLQFISMTA